VIDQQRPPGTGNRPSGMPPPVLDPVNEGMWRAAADGRLDVQRCTKCGAHRYPPTDGCYRCLSLEWEWSTLPGTGTVYTFIWVPDAARAEAEQRPAYYNLVIVELDGTEGEPVRIMSNVLDAWEIGDLHVGQRVELECVPLDGGIGLPCFRTVA
jgi:uncharacterized OB-fold protein